jgi:trehalose-phosphatase
MNTELLKFFDHLEEVDSQLSQKEIFVFLDYDGTLTPIVATPDLAIISEEMRAVVQKLSSAFKVSIVSGRATDDVRSKVRIEDIFYAGSHGFEIVQPDGKVEINAQAQEIRGVIDEVHKKLQERLRGVKGALVEHVKYTISTHYRLVADEDFPKIEKAVEEILNEHTNLRKTQGKKVFEIRPKIDWDKGKAVEWILDVLSFDPQKNIAIYIGDDTTDEDAFAVLQDKGFGILVAQEPRETKAEYLIQDTPEVCKVLEYLIKKGTGSSAPFLKK